MAEQRPPGLIAPSAEALKNIAELREWFTRNILPIATKKHVITYKPLSGPALDAAEKVFRSVFDPDNTNLVFVPYQQDVTTFIDALFKVATWTLVYAKRPSPLYGEIRWELSGGPFTIRVAAWHPDCDLREIYVDRIFAWNMHGEYRAIWDEFAPETKLLNCDEKMHPL